MKTSAPIKAALSVELKVRISEEQVLELNERTAARLGGITRSDIVREALAEYLAKPAQRAGEALQKSGQEKLDRADKAEQENQ
jgi:metal-responsive CopG/Arc/MetJ family transcriptional regulator